MNFRTNILGIAAFLALCCAIVLQVIYLNPAANYAAWGVTVALFAAWAAFNQKALLGFLTRKSTRTGANLSLVIFLVLGILVFVNVLSKEYSWRKDITRSGANSLSAQTLKVLEELPQDVRVMHFNKFQMKDKAEALLKNYSYRSKKFKYEFIDVDRQPTLTTAMGVKANETVVLSLGENGKKVPVEGVTEEKITNGLIKLLKQKEQVVYFTVGHGEHPYDTEAEPLGFGLFRGELVKQGYVVKELNLFSEGKIPGDASLIIVGGPKTAFFPKELEVLGNWLKAGGRSMLMVDLDISENGLAKGSRQIAELLKPFGVTLQNQMLVDPTSRAANVEPQVLLGFSATKNHVITKDFAHSQQVANFLFPLTSHMIVDPNSSFQITPLVVTTAQAWAESDWASLKSGRVSFDKATDYQARMNLAAAIEAKKPEGAKEASPGAVKLVVFADALFAANNMLDKVGNRDLALNAVAWLSDDERFISIRATEDQDRIRQFNNNTLNLVLLVTVFLIPALTILAGVAVWWRRSKL